jgi:GT2 family glycosyltransferase
MAGRLPEHPGNQAVRLSILIVNWRSKDYLRRCLESVHQTRGELAPQIVVVDGGSFDGCGEMLATDFREVKFVQSRENLGFGRSNNLGFSSVTGDTLLLLNPDTELRPGALNRLMAALEDCAEAGIVGPRLLNTDGSLQATCVRALPTPLNQALDSEFLQRMFPKSRLWGTHEAFHSARPVAVEAVSGACMLMRSGVFRHVGGFSPEFFMFGEDMDLCAKVRRLGLKIYHVPEADVLHHGGGSTSVQASQFNIIMMRTAGETYMRRNHGAATAVWYRLLQGFSALVRIGITLPASFVAGSQRRPAARRSAAKWWHVLRWALGFTAVLPPPGRLPGAGGKDHGL